MADSTPEIVSAHQANATRHDYSVSMLAANVYALGIIVPLGAMVLATHIWTHGLIDLNQGFQNWITGGRWIAGVALGTVAHEVLHGVAWKFSGGVPRSAIEFGFNWKALSPYAHCRVPMAAQAYRIGAATPGIVLGLVPVAVGVAMGWGMWTAFGFLFTVAAGGDVLLLWLLRNVPGVWLVEDHPSQAGCVVFVPDGASNGANATAPSLTA